MLNAPHDTLSWQAGVLRPGGTYWYLQFNPADIVGNVHWRRRAPLERRTRRTRNARL
jgi:hypothetical protein